MEKIQGLLVAPFTPFSPDGEVNYEPIARYAAMLHKNGLKGVFINGSSGEGYMLSDEERMRLAERWGGRSLPEIFEGHRTRGGAPAYAPLASSLSTLPVSGPGVSGLWPLPSPR